ncbi:RNA polymerase sigma-70 factor, ECF subfamily [Salinimicrobium catena]|uniref:RNA polymerase sigma-70 factor, ECF subfamily n=1 Tax=Salinimicrobium catena TaxID=390640 RepID=A0A1H5IR07_9FLAO|nr:sigma-70 family RNA polymerase sigma factor [Salinimicrobium catena]SDK79740.1 RNA polymerase sigma-70 factor, ECF subfamily [Salinimicrobium catena]SEE42580.1 RNA polymerase sigma-70 factor, ECF subfamily [Salinimicrobium catena]
MRLKKLISQCRKQDREAQEKLYREYADKLFVLCLKYAGNYEEAKDILQDGFIKIFQNIAQFRGKGTFEGWMTRIMINTALKKYQNRSVFLSIEEEWVEEPEIEDDEELLSLNVLIDLVQELPERYRLVFNLYSLDGYSHKEIAEMLNITEGTSKSNLARARIKLKEKIEDHRTKNLKPVYVEK